MSYENYSYDLPDESSFYETLLIWLKHKNESELFELLKNGKCVLSANSSFSKIRWNAHSLGVYFYVPISCFEKINNSMNETLVTHCNAIIPKENGFDVTFVEFQPLISTENNDSSLIDDLESTVDSLSSTLTKQLLPDDIKQKGKDMMECYLYLYCVENTLRLFIETVAKTNFEGNYFESLNLNTAIKDRLTSRKNDESQNKWKRIRGENDVFYLDFKDLSTIIRNNWEIFSKYFPDQSWIETKINELAECRNLIAHNSYLGDHEKDIIRINFNGILRQLEKTPN